MKYDTQVNQDRYMVLNIHVWKINLLSDWTCCMLQNRSGSGEYIREEDAASDG
jgi:hypothetical protein